MKYANIREGKIICIASMEIEGFKEIPEGANVGDYVIDGVIYIPPNHYSILSAIKNGSPVWTEDTDMKNTEVDAQRRIAYRQESDPLFFKEQAGEIDAGTWQAKRDEIKKRYPKTSV